MQFLLNSAVWEYRCETNEPLSQVMDKMDEDISIGVEML